MAAGWQYINAQGKTDNCLELPSRIYMTWNKLFVLGSCTSRMASSHKSLNKMPLIYVFSFTRLHLGYFTDDCLILAPLLLRFKPSLHTYSHLLFERQGRDQWLSWYTHSSRSYHSHYHSYSMKSHWHHDDGPSVLTTNDHPVQHFYQLHILHPDPNSAPQQETWCCHIRVCNYVGCKRPVRISYWPTQVCIKCTTNSCRPPAWEFFIIF